MSTDEFAGPDPTKRAQEPRQSLGADNSAGPDPTSHAVEPAQGLRPNERVARLLYELGVLSERLDDRSRRYRARAYRRAADAVTALDVDVLSLPDDELAAVPGVGSGTVARIEEIRRTGTIARLEQLRALDPGGAEELLRVPGLGPRMVARLRDTLGIRDIAGLRAALDAGEVRTVRGLGPTSEERLRQALVALDLDAGAVSLPLTAAVPLASRAVAAVRALDDVLEVQEAGALRRFRETIDAIELVAASAAPDRALAAACRQPWVREVLDRSVSDPDDATPQVRATLLMFDGPTVGLTVSTPPRFGAVLVHATGPTAHWERLRRLAAARSFGLRPDGLRDGSGAAMPTPDERAVYAALGLPVVAAEQRDGTDELDLARAGRLPAGARVDDLRGDLHDHTDWSGDGRMTLEQLLAAAADRGWEYIAVTDHAENLRINGLDRATMLAQRELVHGLRRRYDTLAVLHGAELNIAPDGTLDYDDALLSGFDWTVASVHSEFRLDAAAQTRRVIAAIRHPAVRAIGHLTGRRIGRRPGIRLELDVVLDACRETGTALEVNCHLDRLDAPAEILREAAARDVLVVISTDAHGLGELDNHRWGVRQARRGRVPRELVANTWPVQRFVDWARADV
jgi:DNA polymerase (family 10)